MYKQILLAYDGSESGQKALLDCRALVQWSGATLTLVAVMPHHIDFIGAEGGFYDPKLTEREKANYEAILQKETVSLARRNMGVRVHVLQQHCYQCFSEKLQNRGDKSLLEKR